MVDFLQPQAFGCLFKTKVTVLLTAEKQASALRPRCGATADWEKDVLMRNCLFLAAHPLPGWGGQNTFVKPDKSAGEPE